MGLWRCYILEKLFPKLKIACILASVFLLSACGSEDQPCETIQTYLNEGIGDNCLLCGMFDVLTKLATIMAKASWNSFAGELISLVVIASAIYVALTILKSLGSFTAQNAADLFTGDKKGILILMFKMVAIVGLLQDTWFVDSIISPVLEAGLTIGKELSASGAANIISLPSSPGSGGYDDVFTMVNDAVKKFNDNAYETIAIGEAMICNATIKNIIQWYWLMLIYGLILFIFGWVLVVSVSFYIVDILIRLTFGVVLLPFGIACAVSNLTVGYSKNIWNIFINAFFSFIILGIIMGLSMQLIWLSMGRYGDNSGEAVYYSGGGALNSFLSNFNNQIDDNQIKELSQDLWENGSLLLTVVCLAVLVQLIAQVGAIVDKLADASGLTNVGSQVGAAISKPIVNDAKKASSAVTGWAMSGAKYTGHAAARVTRMDRLYDAIGRRLVTARGFLTGSGREGYKAFWHKR